MNTWIHTCYDKLLAGGTVLFLEFPPPAMGIQAESGGKFFIWSVFQKIGFHQKRTRTSQVFYELGNMTLARGALENLSGSGHISHNSVLPRIVQTYERRNLSLYCCWQTRYLRCEFAHLLTGKIYLWTLWLEAREWFPYRSQLPWRQTASLSRWNDMSAISTVLKHIGCPVCRPYLGPHVLDTKVVVLACKAYTATDLFQKWWDAPKAHRCVPDGQSQHPGLCTFHLSKFNKGAKLAPRPLKLLGRGAGGESGAVQDNDDDENNNNNNGGMVTQIGTSASCSKHSAAEKYFSVDHKGRHMIFTDSCSVLGLVLLLRCHIPLAVSTFCL